MTGQRTRTPHAGVPSRKASSPVPEGQSKNRFLRFRPLLKRLWASLQLFMRGFWDRATGAIGFSSCNRENDGFAEISEIRLKSGFKFPLFFFFLSLSLSLIVVDWGYLKLGGTGARARFRS